MNASIYCVINALATAWLLHGYCNLVRLVLIYAIFHGGIFMKISIYLIYCIIHSHRNDISERKPIWIYTYTCEEVFTYTCKNLFTYTCKNLFTYTCKDVFTYTCKDVFTYTCKDVFTYTCKDVFTYTYKDVFTYTCKTCLHARV